MTNTHVCNDWIVTVALVCISRAWNCRSTAITINSRLWELMAVIVIPYIYTASFFHDYHHIVDCTTSTSLGSLAMQSISVAQTKGQKDIMFSVLLGCLTPSWLLQIINTHRVVYYIYLSGGVQSLAVNKLWNPQGSHTHIGPTTVLRMGIMASKITALHTVKLCCLLLPVIWSVMYLPTRDFHTIYTDTVTSIYKEICDLIVIENFIFISKGQLQDK